MIAKIAIFLAAIIIWLLIMCCMIVVSYEGDRTEEIYWRLIEKANDLERELEKRRVEYKTFMKEDENDQT